MKSEIKSLIAQLKKGEIQVSEIPVEYSTNIDIVKVERKLGLRVLGRRGYDVIRDEFFVEEELFDEEMDEWSDDLFQFFQTFDDYYRYLEGKIFDNACYFMLDPKKVNAGVDLKKLLAKSAFIDETIDGYTLQPSASSELDSYKEAEARKPLIQKWIEKFNKCDSCASLKRLIQNYSKSKLGNVVDIRFFYSHYICHALTDLKCFSIMMDAFAYDVLPEYPYCRSLLALYDPDIVIANYRYESGVERTRRKHVKDMKSFAEQIKQGTITYQHRGYFDSATHYFCIETNAYVSGKIGPSFYYNQYYENIGEFVEALKYDLSDCDLSDYITSDFDFSSCTFNQNTRLPLNNCTPCHYKVEKFYRDDRFGVLQTWTDNDGHIVRTYSHEFDYFCDFVYFLKGDLSNADLVSCSNFCNVPPTDQINLKDALLTSDISDKWGIASAASKLIPVKDMSFGVPERNEIETGMILREPREDLSITVPESLVMQGIIQGSTTTRVYYISDIHLDHLFAHKNARTHGDIIRIIRDVASTIVSESDEGSIILIDGDISMDFSAFQTFAAELGRYEENIVFTLGNHDLWSCPDDNVDQVADRYRRTLHAFDMELLQNEVIYYDYNWNMHRISESDLLNTSTEDLRISVREAKLIMFGGIGFSGYNSQYNAETGLYRFNKTIGYNRNIEIRETKRFDTLYEKVCQAFYGKTVLVVTHMPISDWHILKTDALPSGHLRDGYMPGFVYVSGHTHRNYFYDDGEVRVYGDNQFGYNNSNPGAWPHMKYFEVETVADYFQDYEDGIYQISPDDYRAFYRCKKLSMTFTRDTNVLYMLKNDGYYCFIHQAKDGSLSILNGGSLKRLKGKDIQYYYENMPVVIAQIRNPLDQYTNFQERIATAVRDIGGSGKIHGCIIDIDYYNHIYINPCDGTITAYWAQDIVHKVVYPKVGDLLQEQCPQLFEVYEKQLETGNDHVLAILSGREMTAPILSPTVYLDTDIYEASRLLKKLQKMYVNILTEWPSALPVTPMGIREGDEVNSTAR